MKKLFLSVMLVAFAVAVQAGEGKSCDKAQGACSKSTSVQAKAQCSASKEAKASGCCSATAKSQQVKQQKVSSPKATEQAKR